MKSLLMTVLCCGLGTAQAESFASTESATTEAAAWAEVLDLAAETEARLALGIEAVAAAERDTLVARGEAVLAEICGGVTPELDATGRAVTSATDAMVAILERAKRDATVAAWARFWPEESDPNRPQPEVVSIDPWGGVDQECGYFPVDWGEIRLATGEACVPAALGHLARLIAPRYRLAAALGMARFRLVCDPHYFDPVYDRLPSDRGQTVVHARLHCEFSILLDPLKPDSGPALAPDAQRPAVTAGRLAITSQSRMMALYDYTTLPPGYWKWHKIGSYSVSKYFGINPSNGVWQEETPPAAAAERGWRLEPAVGKAASSKADSSAAESWVGEGLTDRLQALQREVAQSVRDTPEVAHQLRVWRDTTTRFLERASADASRAPETPSHALAAASRRLEVMMARAWPDDGRLEAGTLNRIGPALATAVRSVRRAVQVAAAPASHHGPAAELAARLDSLESWKLR